MIDTADVIVVGLGAVGSATCHHLARSGAKVIGIDRFRPPHDQGSSHGLTRITRLAIGEGEVFVPLATRSHVLWRELEEATGESLYLATGGLIVASAENENVARADHAAPDGQASSLAYHGQASFLAQTIETARRFGIDHDLLDAATIRERFPQFAVADHERGYHEPAAGVLFAERIVAAQLATAEQLGAALRLDERVLAIESVGSDVEVVTDRGRLQAARVIVTAGAWLPGFGGAALASRLRVLRQVLYWFHTDQPALFAPERCPIWIWLHGPGAAGSMYGFPMVDGVDGVKVASEQDAVVSDPDRVDRQVSGDDEAAMFDRHIAGRLRGVGRRVVRSATCLYTSTADASFVVEPHPLIPAVTLVSACSGHGFKHSAALGESLAAQVAASHAPRWPRAPA